MPTRILAIAALLLAIVAVALAYSQQSALQLGRENQPLYSPRYRTLPSGQYRDGRWVRFPNRRSYTRFPGGGPGVGK